MTLFSSTTDNRKQIVAYITKNKPKILKNFFMWFFEIRNRPNKNNWRAVTCSPWAMRFETHALLRTNTCTHSLSPSHICSLSHLHYTHTHTLSPSHIHSLSHFHYTHTPSLPLSLTYTDSHRGQTDSSLVWEVIRIILG